jgi:hypothetical protein
MNDQEYIRDRLSDPWWRLNNLYYITDKQGKRVKFQPNWAQRILYNGMWYLNIVLKARQLGMTTFIQIFMLDRCLFNDDVNAGVIAHNREDAEDFFHKKIKFAYDNLPDWLKAERPATSDSAKQLEFSNGSSIRVGTSLRSGTYQYLHISEFGKVCAKYPDKAREIISGSLNTVDAGQFVWIESTAEGAWGRFYEMCIDAERKQLDGTDLTQLDYKFFFFPWWEHPDYSLDGDIYIPAEMEKYFNDLEESRGIQLTKGQRNWYMKKAEVQKKDMKQEYPSTSEEAFEQVPEGAIYADEMQAVKDEGRVTHLPVEQAPIYTFWDLGVGKGEICSIWLMQKVGTWHNFIGYIQGAQRGLDYYVKELDRFDEVHCRGKAIWATDYLPHDGDHPDKMMTTPKEHIERLGRKHVEIVPRIPDITFGIQDCRQMFPTCRFDKERCVEGIRALQAYHYATDERRETSKPRPEHDWASHGADAFRAFGSGFRPNAGWAGVKNNGKVDHRRALPRGSESRSKNRFSTDASWKV